MKHSSVLLSLAFLLLLNAGSVFECYAQANLDSLLSQIEAMRSQNAELVQVVDSLSKVVDNHGIEWDLIGTIVSEQTAIFSIIVALLLGIIGFITFQRFKSEVAKVNGSIETLKEEVETSLNVQQKTLDTQLKDFDKRLKEMETVLYKSLTRILLIIKNISEDKDELCDAFIYSISAARACQKSYNYNEDKDEKKVVFLLDEALRFYDRFKKDKGYVKSLKEVRSKVVKHLDELVAVGGEEVKMRSSRLRTYIDEYIA